MNKKDNILLNAFLILISLSLILFACNKEKENQVTHDGHTMAGKESTSAPIYYCPMDTHIVQNTPGTCPICEMDLEIKPNHEHGATLADKNSTSTPIYYCPMDTHIVQNTPGTCPICEMDLEIKPGATAAEEEWVLNPANASVLSTVKSIKPTLKSVPVNIKSSGYITYDTRRIYNIATRVGGRIEKLYVKYKFQPIRKGEILFEIFSHELQTAQQEYLFLKRNDRTATDLIGAAKKKLMLLGMTENQISNLNDDGHMHFTTSFFSPYSGFIVEQDKDIDTYAPSSGSSMNMGNTPNMNSQGNDLAIREGSYVNQGQTIFKVANTDIVWGILEIFSSHLPSIKVNQTVHIKIENSDEKITGKIDFIEPSYKEGTGTAKLRVYINNKDHKLKIGNLISAEIDAGVKKGLWIPQTAVYDLGREKVVFIKRNGAFETRKVITGTSSGNEIEIVSGINEEDEIAENSQFMIDSESFVKIRKD